MTAPEPDVTAFFSELKEKYGIDFEDSATSSELARARELSQETPPEAPIPDPEEAVEEERYPGSKQALRPVDPEEIQKARPVAPPIPWDELPARTYTVRGRETEFYTVGSLAKALQREVVTLRKWEQKGYLPAAQYRAPGKKAKQDRLYTREQIEGLAKILQEEGLLLARKKMRIDQTNFPERAHRLFDRLAQQRQES